MPSSFAAGRYEVKSFLGEGGRKNVYLAHDTRLDREVAVAVIKTDGLDEAGLVRVRREAQAMGGWETTITSLPCSTSARRAASRSSSRNSWPVGTWQS